MLTKFEVSGEAQHGLWFLGNAYTCINKYQNYLRNVFVGLTALSKALFLFGEYLQSDENAKKLQHGEAKMGIFRIFQVILDTKRVQL